MNIKKYISGALALATVAGIGLALPLFAQNAPTTATTPPSGWTRGVGGSHVGMTRPTVVGTVASVADANGTLTITGKQFIKPTDGSTPVATTAIYTVNTSATTVVTKNGVASTVSLIAVNDTVSVQGTVSGGAVTATSIRDGVMSRGQGGKAGGSAGANANVEANLVAGNGQPVIGGTITTIGAADSSGNATLTVTNKSNIVYTVSVSDTTKFVQGQTTITLAKLNKGDTVVVQGVVVQGTVNGASVTASTIIDQGQPAAAGTTGTTAKHSNFLGGIFGGIGSFFSHLFGF